MTYPGGFRNTDRHTMGAKGEEAILAFLAEHGVEVEDLRSLTTDAQVRFRANGITFGTQVRTAWDIDGHFEYKDTFTDWGRTLVNDLWIFHSLPVRHVLWAAKGDDPDDPWPLSWKDRIPTDRTRTDQIQPWGRYWNVREMRHDWKGLIQLLTPVLDLTPD